MGHRCLESVMLRNFTSSSGGMSSDLCSINVVFNFPSFFCSIITFYLSSFSESVFSQPNTVGDAEHSAKRKRSRGEKLKSLKGELFSRAKITCFKAKVIRLKKKMNEFINNLFEERSQ